MESTSPTQMIITRRKFQLLTLDWGTTLFAGIVRPDQSVTASDVVIQPGTTNRVLGYLLYQPVKRGSLPPGGGFFSAWLDWVTVRYKKLPVDQLPDSVLAPRDTTVKFTVNVTGGPAGVTYRWKYVGAVTDSTAPTFTRQMTGRLDQCHDERADAAGFVRLAGAIRHRSRVVHGQLHREAVETIAALLRLYSGCPRSEGCWRANRVRA